MSAWTDHRLTGTVVYRYAMSQYAERVIWQCSCGRSGAVLDGRAAPTKARAVSAFGRHKRAAQTKATS